MNAVASYELINSNHIGAENSWQIWTPTPLQHLTRLAKQWLFSIMYTKQLKKVHSLINQLMDIGKLLWISLETAIISWWYIFVHCRKHILDIMHKKYFLLLHPIPLSLKTTRFPSLSWTSMRRVRPPISPMGPPYQHYGHEENSGPLMTHNDRPTPR